MLFLIQFPHKLLSSMYQIYFQTLEFYQLEFLLNLFLAERQILPYLELIFSVLLQIS